MIFTTVLFQGAFAFVGVLMVACFVGVAVIPRFNRREPLGELLPLAAGRRRA